MHDSASLILAIVGSLLTYTATIIGAAMWLAARLRGVEKMFYAELDKRREINDKRFRGHGTRIQRLEIKAFGFTGPTLIEPPTDSFVEPK